MINRAKCLQCESIIESHLPNDMVKCKCGLIAVCDGPAMRMWPSGSPHFVRIDDMGNEIVVKYVAHLESEEQQQPPDHEKKDLSLQEAIEAFERSIEYNESMPYHAQTSFVMTMEVTAYLRSILNIVKLRQ